MQWLLSELENMVIELYMAYEHRNYRRSVKSQGKSLIIIAKVSEKSGRIVFSGL